MSSTNTLLKAIEGFTGENAGNREHESSIELLKRVAADIQRGKGAAPDSPGRREALGAAQRNMAAESSHSAGDGQKGSNEPGSAHDADPAPNPNPSHGGPDEKMWGAGPVPSHGNRMTVASVPFPGGVAEIRRIAAEKEAARPDSKISALEGRADGNNQSLAKAPAAEPSGRIGDVAPLKGVPSDRDMQKGKPESSPPYAKESVSGSAFGRAAEEAKRRLAAKR